MLNRRLIPSSLGEAEYLTDGTFAVSVPGSGVQTNTQLVPLPAGESAIRYPAIRPDGQIAGQPQNTVRGAWIWNNASGWSTDPRIPASPNPVIYDLNGLLHINELGPGYVGSQGFRYVNPSNQVISGDATYAARNGVAEWIDLSLAQDGSLLVGYAIWTLACVIWDGTHHRLLEAGNAHRLKAHRDGDKVAIAITKDTGCMLIDGTVADLLALPIFEPAPEPQPPEPIPPIPPEPPIPQPPNPPHPHPLLGAFMIDPKEILLYKQLKPSSRTGCVNVILHDDTVASVQPDGSLQTRPAGSDGAFEQAEVTGNIAAFHSFDNNYHAFGLASIAKVI